MANEWYFAQNGAQQGPVSPADLRQMAADGRLGHGDLVWTDTMANWQPAGSVSALMPAGGNRPPPLPALAPTPPVAGVPLGYAGLPSAGAYAQPADLGQNAGVRWLLPVGRSGWAIAAGYLGLLSFVPIFGPVALALGLLAVRDLKKHPNRHGWGRAIFGLVMGVLASAVLAFVLVNGGLRRF